MVENDKKELLLFQLGPVQEFIAQAETIEDLRVGSEILSELTAEALKVIPEYWNPDVGVFPAVEKDRLTGIPNRFLVCVPCGEGETLAKKAVGAARDFLKNTLAQTVREKLPQSRREAFNRQVESFLQTSWAVLKEPTNNMGKDYKIIGKLMAMRRNVRAFDSWCEEAAGQVKDFLSGKEAALDVADNRAPNRNSGRGAMNLIKKFRIEKPQKIKLGDYIAVIALDGDHMGEKLSGFSKKEEHRDFSKKLADYAVRVKVSEEDGVLIYAGGDDVLAVVKATRAFEIAEKLADQFVEALNEPGERKVTASVGVAIGSAKAPLQDIIQEARVAEGRAKHVYGRDALAVSIMKRSGEILHWGCKWKTAVLERSPALEIFDKLTANSDTIADFAHKLAGFLAPYELGRRDKDGNLITNWNDMKPVVRAEVLHTIGRTEGMSKLLEKTVTEDGIESYSEIEGYLSEKTVTDHPEDFLGLFLCETFINRPRD